jgi:YjbE family integral membrane protein
MGIEGHLDLVGTSFKVFCVDLLLSGDNAIVIALACRSLPPRQMRLAMILGTLAAILLRLVLAVIVTDLLAVPYLKLVGALALIVIAVKLTVGSEEGRAEEAPRNADAGGSAADADRTAALWTAASLIVAADAAMSLDNVVALAAVAQGRIFFLALGILASIPLLMYGSVIIVGLMNRYPILIAAGGVLLGWLAGDMAMSDPAIADWVNSQAPALPIVMPALCAVFVLLQSRLVERERLKDQAR